MNKRIFVINEAKTLYDKGCENYKKNQEEDNSDSENLKDKEVEPWFS